MYFFSEAVNVKQSKFVCRVVGVWVCVHFSFSAFKLFSNLTDLIGAVRLICTFRSLCDESNFVLSAVAAATVAVVFATIFRKYLLSPRGIDSLLTIWVAVIGCCHSLLIRPPKPPSSPFLIAESWLTGRERSACCAAATRPIDAELVIGVALVMGMAGGRHLLAILCVLFASKRIFLPITELDNGRFGNDAANADDADDNVFDVCDVNDELDTLDAVDMHAVVECDAESSSSLRLLATKKKTKY